MKELENKLRDKLGEDVVVLQWDPYEGIVRLQTSAWVTLQFFRDQGMEVVEVLPPEGLWEELHRLTHDPPPPPTPLATSRKKG